MYPDPCFPLSSQRDGSSTRVSVLEEASPVGVSTQPATGSLCRRMWEWIGPPSSRTCRRDPGVPVRRSARVKGLFPNMQGHARFRAPSHRESVIPRVDPEAEVEHSIHEIPVYAVQGGLRSLREIGRRRSSRIPTIHPTLGHQDGPPSTHPTVPTNVHLILPLSQQTPNPRHTRP